MTPLAMATLPLKPEARRNVSLGSACVARTDPSLPPLGGPSHVNRSGRVGTKQMNGLEKTLPTSLVGPTRHHTPLRRPRPIHHWAEDTEGHVPPQFVLREPSLESYLHINKWTTAAIPDLTGKVIVVTGANSGIGYEAAKELARKGGQTIKGEQNHEILTIRKYRTLRFATYVGRYDLW